MVKEREADIQECSVGDCAEPTVHTEMIEVKKLNDISKKSCEIEIFLG
jgi:hypothetical protein